MKLKISDSCQIRSYRPDDVNAIVKYANNRNVWVTLRDSFPSPYTKADAEEWLDIISGQIPESSFAVSDKKELIGGIGLVKQGDVYRLSGEVGFWLGEPFWGKGIATKILTAFTQYVFGNYEIIKIYAYVFSSNPASARVLEKSGYLQEGCLRNAVIKDGKIMDQLVYGILKEEIEQ